MCLFKSKFDRLSVKEVKLQSAISAEEKDTKDAVDAVNKSARAEIESIKAKSAKRMKALKAKLDLVTRHKNAEHDHVVSEAKQSK